MAVTSFTFDPHWVDSFVRFSYEHYRGDTNWIPPIRSELKKQFAREYPFYQKPGNSHRHFMASTGGKVLGRVSAMCNGDLKDKDGTPVGTIGFFECVDDYHVAQDLISTAVQWLHQEQGIKCIWGPMNFDIWHSYRFMTKGFDQKLFYGEPYNKPYYPDFFDQSNFVTKCLWDSVEITGREALQSMIERGKKRYELLIERGYRFELFDLKRFDAESRKLHLIICKSFHEFLGFTPISYSEFGQLFAASRYAIHPQLSMFAYDENNDLAAFSILFLEVSDAVRSMNGKDGLLSKWRFLRNRRNVDRINYYIGGIVPKEITKRSGLGRAGFYFAINQMLKEDYDKLLLTLRLKGNFAHALARKNDTEPQREYALYELNL